MVAAKRNGRKKYARKGREAKRGKGRGRPGFVGAGAGATTPVANNRQETMRRTCCSSISGVTGK